MRSYPFTSRVTYDEQGLPLYDRAVDSDFLRKVFAQYFSDGVFYDPTSSMQVTIDTGMNVKVLPGVCHIRGAIGIEETQRVLAVQASDSLDRIDTVVARLDLGLDVRSIDLYVRKGTAANTPVAPPLTRDNTVWELGLADIFVAKNTGTITQQRITDTRLDDTRCGVVAQIIGDLDTTPYFDQIQATLDDLRRTIQDVKSGDIVLSINGQRGDIVAGPELLSAAHDVHTHTKSQITDFAHNHTKSQITDFSHTHPKSQITDFPTALKNPYALTLQINGATNKTYDGGSAQTYNVTTDNLGLYKKLWSGTLNEGGSISASWINDWNGFIILTTQHKFITVDKRPGEYIKGLSGFALDKGLIQIIGLYLMISGTTLKYQAMQGMQCNLNTAQISKQAQSFPITTIYGINKPL